MHLQAFSVPASSVRCLLLLALLSIFALAFAFHFRKKKLCLSASIQ